MIDRRNSSSLPSMWLLLLTLVLVSFTSLLYITKHRDNHDSSNGMRGSKMSRIKDNNGHDTKSLFNELQGYVHMLEDVVSKLNSSSVISDHKLTHIETDNKGLVVDRKVWPPPKHTNQESFTAENSNEGTVDDVETKKWLEQLSHKLRCLRLHTGGVYLYHTRKAAGTTVRDIIAQVADQQWKVPYYETEGIVMPQSVLKVPSLLTVTTLREPIKRVLSLYWYEHVGWYEGVLNQCKARCKTLNEWVAAWRDNSEWKRNFMRKNPDSVYVEIENYYVKMLSGWNKIRKNSNEIEEVTEKHLDEAKAALRSFDVVLLSDWMGDETQIDAVNALFPGRSNVAAGHKVKGDYNIKTRLTPTLAPDEDTLRDGILREINKWDLMLWDYAQQLMAYRLKLIIPTINSAVKAELGLDSHRDSISLTTLHQHNHQSASHTAGLGKYIAQCKADKEELDKMMGKKGILHSKLGIFQPPGHKGPL